MRVERLIARAPPMVNCMLFLTGLHVGLKILMAHLAWYGFPRAPLGTPADAQRFVIKLVLFLVVIAMVGLCSPGSPRRRIFAACTFPLVGVLAMVATAVVAEFADCVRLPDYPIAEAAVRGLGLGLLMATLISLPTALLYRGSAVPVAILSVLPAVAKAGGSFPEPNLVDSGEGLIWRLGPYVFALVVVAASTYACCRLQTMGLGARGRR